MIISGRAISGTGEGASLTQADWARPQFIEKLGIDPHPGTLNLVIDNASHLISWRELKQQPGIQITTPDRSGFEARCYSIRIDGRYPGAIILPELLDYPETQVEIIAAIPLRQQLSLQDGDTVTVESSRALTISAIIFDLDGTLVDSVEAYRVLAERAAAPFDIPITREVVCQALNNNFPPFWELVVPAEWPNQAEVIKRMKQTAKRVWPEVVREYAKLFPGIGPMLDQLRRQRYRLAILTASHGGSLRILEEAGLLEFFELIITASDVERRKPDPEGLFTCLQALNVEPDQAAYVGDTPLDIQASKSAGMASVAVLSGAGDSALLSAEGPDWIIHRCAALPEILAVKNR